eukprot:1325227-Amorphochlora_amoeboformis.AAC.1
MQSEALANIYNVHPFGHCRMKDVRASIRSANTRTGFNSPRNSVSRGSRNSPSSRPARCLFDFLACRNE